MPARKVDSLKVAVHLGCLFPLAWLTWDGFSGGLGFNPIRDITLRTGRDALALLILSLACSPAAGILGLRAALRIRRTLGVYAFVYASLHFLTFVGLDYAFDPALIIEGIFAKPFALVGLTAFLLLLPLAVTSTNGMKRRLGKNWKRLHRAVYVAAPLVIVHFLWAAKQDYGEPVTYGVVVAVLLVLRIPLSRSRSVAKLTR